MKYLPIFLFLLLPACSGDNQKNPAPDQCKALIQALCKHKLECGSQVAQARCEGEIDLALECDKATGVSNNYNQCMADVPKADCIVSLISAPVSCSGVI